MKSSFNLSLYLDKVGYYLKKHPPKTGQARKDWREAKRAYDEIMDVMYGGRIGYCPNSDPRRLISLGGTDKICPKTDPMRFVALGSVTGICPGNNPRRFIALSNLVSICPHNDPARRP